MVRLTGDEWEFIFKALDMARTVFAKNPVLQDVMEDDDRHKYIEVLSDIMDKIGKDGKVAYKEGVEPNESRG